MAEIVALSQTQPVRVEREGPVHRLTLAAPPANALSIRMMEALRTALAEAASDPDCRVVVIAGEGRVFSAGHDLKELTAHRADPDGGRAFYDRTMRLCADLMQDIVRHPRPVIAEIGGVATAAGIQLVASCDLAIASEEATFATPGVNIGLFCSTPMVALSRNLSPKHAMEMLLTGETIDARSAREFGLVNRVVPPQYLPTIVHKYTSSIAAKSAVTVKIGKEAFYRQAEMTLAEAYDYAAGVMVENMMTADAGEGISAFIEKRKPDWSHE